MSANECRCGKPTRDDSYVCDACSDALSVALGEIPWLAEELEVTISGQKGATYDGHTSRGAETPSPVHWGASEAKTHLKALLVSWALFSAQEGIRNQSPQQELPADDLIALSRWMLWRVDGLSLHDIGPDAVDEITSAVAHCHRLIDRPADRQFLGHCQECDEDGRLYARPGGTMARCNVCGSTVNAEALRTRMLAELEDRLCTAAEIAHLSTHLGLRANREQVRKRINQWHKRGVIVSESIFVEEPAFRFGDIYARLMGEEYGRKAS